MTNKIHKITDTEPGSISHELGVEPGDCLISVNGKTVHDVFDYRFMIYEEELLIEIQKPDGEIWELDIEKEAGEDLGLCFEKSLMDNARACQNRCVFCFIDQLPSGMRPTLYFKDDDPRLSFLTGNYVTLTNLTNEESERIAKYKLSPLRVSVHAVNASLRKSLLNHPRAGELFTHLRRFANAGITLHFQVVLCKGINDGAVLDETIGSLLELYPSASSLSVVPVGLTKHRDGLFALEPFTENDAAAVIKQIHSWQILCREKYGTSFVFCSDEWYIKAGEKIPSYKHYEDFPQLENGVGMCALFSNEFNSALRKRFKINMKDARRITIKKAPSAQVERKIGIVTGISAYSFMKELTCKFAAQHPNTKFSIYPVRNDFFGETVTVSGLLTGRDIVAQVRSRAIEDGCCVLFLPPNIFRDGTTDTLDGMTAADLQNAFPMQVKIGCENGAQFAAQLY